jgi:hypothetical protein
MNIQLSILIDNIEAANSGVPTLNSESLTFQSKMRATSTYVTKENICLQYQKIYAAAPDKTLYVRPLQLSNELKS